jgi:NADH dehydrogenase [ubiquinone] 1 alpha subcomplex assembly factor 7
MSIIPTTLTRHLLDTIRMTGPISTSTYMRHALIHPLGGYYSTKQSIQSGLPHSSKSGGDFITSPEISQIFVSYFKLIFVG